MKLVNPSFEIYEQGPGLEGIYEAIERAGRTCYKSTRPEGQTAKDFVDRMIASQHYAMLEHGTVYLKVPNGVVDGGFQFGTNWSALCLNPYTKYNSECNYYYYTTNYRVIIENDLQGVLEYLCEPTEFHEKRVTVRFTTSNGIMREFTRHRSHSFAVESTRYCNYSKDKFNSELTFIQPSWFNKEICGIDYIKYPTLPKGFFPEYDYTYLHEEKQIPVTKEAMFIWSLLTAEKSYLEATKLGAKPQEAREVLPLATKCDMVMTGFIVDWQHFFDLRARGTTGAPHPDAKALAEPLMQEFIKINLITE